MQLARRRIAIVRSTDRVGMHEATGGSERTVRRGTRGSLASQSRMRVYKGRMSCAMRFGDASAHTMTDAHNVHITAAWPWTDAFGLHAVGVPQFRVPVECIKTHKIFTVYSCPPAAYAAGSASILYYCR